MIIIKAIPKKTARYDTVCNRLIDADGNLQILLRAAARSSAANLRGRPSRGRFARVDSLRQEWKQILFAAPPAEASS
jgi:hypothetical protein